MDQLSLKVVKKELRKLGVEQQLIEDTANRPDGLTKSRKMLRDKLAQERSAKRSGMFETNKNQLRPEEEINNPIRDAVDAGINVIAGAAGAAGMVGGAMSAAAVAIERRRAKIAEQVEAARAAQAAEEAAVAAQQAIAGIEARQQTEQQQKQLRDLQQSLKAEEKLRKRQSEIRQQQQQQLELIAMKQAEVDEIQRQLATKFSHAEQHELIQQQRQMVDEQMELERLDLHDLQERPLWLLPSQSLLMLMLSLSEKSTFLAVQGLVGLEEATRGTNFEGAADLGGNSGWAHEASPNYEDEWAQQQTSPPPGGSSYGVWTNPTWQQHDNPTWQQHAAPAPSYRGWVAPMPSPAPQIDAAVPSSSNTQGSSQHWGTTTTSSSTQQGLDAIGEFLAEVEDGAPAQAVGPSTDAPASSRPMAYDSFE